MTRRLPVESRRRRRYVMLRLSLHWLRHGDGVTSCGTPTGDEYHRRAVDDGQAVAVGAAASAAGDWGFGGRPP